MSKFLYYCRLYFLLIGKYIQVRLQYRTDFVISTIGILFINVSTVLGMAVVFQSIPQLAGWRYEEIVFIYAFSLLAQSPLQILFDHIWSLRVHVNQGTFIKYYFKPIPTLFYYVSEMVDLKGFGQCIFGIGALIWASLQLGIDWTVPRLILFPIFLASSSVIFISLMLMAASAAFWIKDSFAIISFVSSFREHSRYPMGIYNSFFQFVFTWVIPIGFIAFYPSQFFLRDVPPDWSAWAAPFLAVLLYLLALKVWNTGVKVWGGTGS